MSDVVPSTDPYDPAQDPDTDSTMTAPEGDRPDGKPAPTGDETVQPSREDAPPDE